MPTFEYVSQVIRAPVRARKKRGKYSQGAYITVPYEWQGQNVKVHQELNPKENRIDEVKSSPPRFAYVSLPIEWVDTNVIVELIKEQKRKS